MKRFLLLMVVIFSATCWAQVSGSPVALFFTSNAVDPATCSPGQVEFNTVSAVVKFCLTSNTWTNAGATFPLLAPPGTVGAPSYANSVGTTGMFFTGQGAKSIEFSNFGTSQLQLTNATSQVTIPNWNFVVTTGNITDTAGQFISSVVTGTAPFSIASTTQVANLNVASCNPGCNLNGTVTSGVQGTGAVVLASTPTLTTPVLGAATGTSLNLGATGVLSTTAQSGTGSLCMTTNCVMTTPTLGAATGTSLSVSGALTSTVATGTAPLVVSSTTTVPTLTVSNHPKIQFCGTTATCSATAQTSTQIVYGSAALSSGTPSTVTITGISPAFTSSASYDCNATDETTAANNLLKVVNVSGSSFTITGPATVTDVISYVCVGN